MFSIIDSTIDNSAKILESYENLLGHIAKEAKGLRQQLENEGRIVPIPALTDVEAGSVSLCAIDGASASEKMQSGDLLVAGSSLHDGGRSKRIYMSGDPETPALGYSDIRLHSSKNEKVLSSMRAFTEIAVLGATTKHNIAIIDGAYLGNFLTVLYNLQESFETAENIINFLGSDSEGYFIQGLRDIFNLSLKDNSHKEVVALAKSDSSRDLVKRLVGDDAKSFMSDKILAEYLLLPGEMLAPYKVNANAGRVQLTEATSDDYGWSGFRWKVREVLTVEQMNTVESFFSLNEKNEDYGLRSLFEYLFAENNYHYSYFKPTKFQKGSHALRMEFTTKRSSKKTPDDILAKGIELVSHINADVLDPGIKEPFSQFMVDKAVKAPVSSSMAFLKNKLSGMVSSNEHLLSAISSYRT